MCVALQDFNCVAVCDVIKADPVGRQDLITHLDTVLLCEATGVQPEDETYKRSQRQAHVLDLCNFLFSLCLGFISCVCSIKYTMFVQTTKQLGIFLALAMKSPEDYLL